MLTTVCGTQRTSALSPQACPESGGSSDALEGPWDPAAVTGPDPNLPKLPQGTNRPISFLCRLRTSVRCSPGGHSRNPARNVRAISLVLCTERLLQRWLFVGNDKQVEGQPEQPAEQNEAPIAEQHSLTKNDCDHGDVDRIAYVPVETSDHQVLGRRNGCRCTESLQRKSRKGVHKSGQTDQDEKDADCPRDLKTQKCRPKRPASHRPRDQPCEHTRRNHKEERRAQDGTHLLHGHLLMLPLAALTAMVTLPHVSVSRLRPVRRSVRLL